MTSFAGRIKKAFSDMKVHRKLIVAYVLTGLFPMCLMFTLFYTQMRRVLVEREIKNLQTTFDRSVGLHDGGEKSFGSQIEAIVPSGNRLYVAVLAVDGIYGSGQT